MTDTSHTYRFVIDALTPDSLPMAQLAEYMANLARLLGHREHVHFDRVAPGSAVLVQRVEEDYAGQIRERLDAVRSGGPVPDDVVDAMESINTLLAKDNTTGCLQDHSNAEVIFFPGRDKPYPPTFGPFEQLCSFDGVLIRIGGKVDPVPVHLQADDEVRICHADRNMACRLAPHLYQGTLRVWGDGRWERESNGNWKLHRFNISEFMLLDDAPIGQVVEKLRKVEGSGWKQFDDPLAEMIRLRRDSLED